MAVIFSRLLPLIFITSTIMQLDRSSIGFAALTMNKDLGLTPYVFGLIAGIFALGYILFEIPSNIALYRLGADRWIGMVMLLWGLVLVGMGFVHNATGLGVARFLLGVFESGFNPGIGLYTILWLPLRYRARFIVLYAMSVPAAGIIGGPLASLLFGLNGVGGFAGWQWLFFAEGALAVLCAFPTYRLLTPSPAKAAWLADDQRAWVTQELESDTRAVRQHSSLSSALGGIANWRVWTMGILNIGLVMGIYGVNLWMPTIVKSLGTLSIVQTSLLISLIWICAGIAAYVWARYTDRTKRHYVNLAIPLLVGGVGFLISAFSGGSPLLSIIFLIVASSGVISALTIFWVVPSLFLTGVAVATGIALVNSLGNIGGFLSPFLIGWIKQETGSFQNGFLVLACGMLIAGCISLAIRPRNAAAPTITLADVKSS